MKNVTYSIKKNVFPQNMLTLGKLCSSIFNQVLFCLVSLKDFVVCIEYAVGILKVMLSKMCVTCFVSFIKRNFIVAKIQFAVDVFKTYFSDSNL